MSRPTQYTDELGKEIAKVVSSSSLGIRALCKKHKHWPRAQQIWLWRSDPSLPFADLYARAKQSQIEVMVERIFALTKDKKHGYLIDKDGKAYPDHTYLQKMRIEVDAIKWLAAKLAPKIYGTKNEDKGDGGSYLEKEIDNI